MASGEPEAVAHLERWADQSRVEAESESLDIGPRGNPMTIEMTLAGFRVTTFRSVEDSGWIDVDDVTALTRSGLAAATAD